MFDGLNDMMHDMKVDGKAIQPQMEWTPYNPFTIPFDNKTWDLDPVSDWLKWYNERMFGYPGLSTKNYLTMSAELLKDDLDNRLRLDAEFGFMQTLYQLLKHAGDTGSQQVYQMPEDFYREFVKNAETLSDDIKNHYLSIKRGFVWTHAVMSIAPVHTVVGRRITAMVAEMTDPQPIPQKFVIHNFKLACMYFLQEMLRRKAPYTTLELYKLYEVTQKNYWNNVLCDFDDEPQQLKLNDIVDKDLHARQIPRWGEHTFKNFIFDGRKVTVNAYFAPVNEILVEEIEW